MANSTKSPITITTSQSSVRKLIDQLKTDGIIQDDPATRAIILPSEDHTLTKDDTFPSGTRDFLLYAQQKCSGQIQIDIAVKDKKLLELGLHSDIFILPLIALADPAAAAMAINVISNYIYDHLITPFPRKKSIVKSELILDQGDTTIRLKYDGPAETYERVIQKALNKLAKLGPKE